MAFTTQKEGLGTRGEIAFPYREDPLVEAGDRFERVYGPWQRLLIRHDDNRKNFGYITLF